MERGRNGSGSSSAEPGKGVRCVPTAGTGVLGRKPERGGVPTEEPLQTDGGTVTGVVTELHILSSIA